MKFHNKRGFVLLVIVSILGVLAMLGVAFSLQAKSTKMLASLRLLDSKSYLLARSGLELKKNLILAELMTGNILSSPLNFGNSLTTHTFNSAQKGSDIVSAWAQDLSGAINLNDGIAAGKMDQGTLYDARALDPWPVDPSDPTANLEDISALINLRLRRILNAYGDSHKFAAEIGWPTTAPAAVVGQADGPNYGKAFAFTSTAAGNRYSSQPALDNTGLELTVNADIVAMSTGLGDRLIAARPDKGWTAVEEVRDIIGAWAQEHLPSTYLEDMTFFERVASDLTTTNWEDDRFFRMVREFGPDLDGDGHADYQNDVTWNRMSPRGQPSQLLMAYYDSDPPQLSDLWRPHSVSLVNFNSASDAVRAALLYAPVNVSLVAEGAAMDNFALQDVKVAGGGTYTQTSPHTILSSRDCLGTSGPVFQTIRMRENGIWLDIPAQPMHSIIQRNRLMSLRDAMMLAQAYREWSTDAWGLGTTWADSFTQFKVALRGISENAQPLERASYNNKAIPHPSWTTSQMTFDQQYLEQILPEIFSTQRRLPGWLGAPVSHLSPCIGQAEGSGYFNPPMNRLGYARRSAEDFVFRHHLPKISFLPTGHYRIRSEAKWSEGADDVMTVIEATFELFKTAVRRTQSDFIDITDPMSDPSVLIGPEPSGVTPSPWLGMVGLRDREVKFPGPRKYGMRMLFDGDTAIEPGSNLQPMDPAIDPEIGMGMFTQEQLKDSEMEGETSSLFTNDASGTNLSPFGGMLFDSRDHGVRGSDPFTDSLYIRPRKQMLAPNGLIGTHCNVGTLSLWVRVPSGYHMPNAKKNIVHMTFWENMEIKMNGAAVPPAPPTAGTHYHIMPRSTTLSMGFWGRPSLGSGFNDTGALMNLETRQTTSMTRPNVFGMDFSMFTDMSYLSGLGTIPAPRTQIDHAMGQNQYYSNTMGSIYKDFQNQNDVARPSTDWYMPQSTHPLPGTVIDYALSTGFRQETQAGIALPYDPYMARPGSWMRLVMKWDFSNQMLHAERNFMTTAHETWNYGHWNLGGFMDLGMYPQRSRFYNSICNPKMMISFGERVDPRPMSWMVSHSGHAALPGSLNEGDIAPWERLNSSIDNIVLSFGELPDSNFACDTLPKLVNGTQIDAFHDAVENISGFDNVRYEVATQPRWVVAPNIQFGSRIIAFGARIYDVPFLPMLSGAHWQNWKVKSPAVELNLEEEGLVVAEITIAQATEANGVIYKSPSFKTYGAHVVGEKTRFRITYLDRDPNGDPMGNDLTDIPWIEDLNWRYLPPGGPVVVSWSQF